MSLALAIPVHNDAGPLVRLLRQAAEMRIFDQLVICDDGSDEPIRADTIPDALRERHVILRNARPAGAGMARNQALASVTSSHLLFFDADDTLTPEFPRLWRSLAQEDFDFCLFRHHDSRNASYGGWGQMPGDDLMWHRTGLGGCALREVPPAAGPTLAETANYPWNKIYRTDFLRQNDIGCSDVPMHEDVELHWLSFHAARRILASDRIAAVHVVDMVGNRLTNRRDAARLDAFAPFDRVATRMARPATTGAEYLPAFLRFISGLALWMRGNLHPQLHKRLEEAVGALLRRHANPAAFSTLAESDPLVAWRILFQMTGDNAEVASSLSPYLAPFRHRTPPPSSGLAPLDPAHALPDADLLRHLHTQVLAA